MTPVISIVYPAHKYVWCDTCDQQITHHYVCVDEVLATLKFPTDVEKERVRITICYNCLDKMVTMLEHEQRSK